MSTTAGVFSETLLQNQFVRADEIRFDDRINKQFIPRAEVVKAIMALQTADIRLLSTRDKNVTMEVWWDNFCGMAVRECVPCDVGGTKGSTNTKTYTLQKCKEVAFSVNANDFIDNYANMENHIAKQMLTAEKLLAEYVAQTWVAVLNANAGINQLDGFQGVVAGTETTIDPAYWTPEILAYFMQVIDQNQFTDPSMITGSLLLQQSIVAAMNSGNADGKGAANMFNNMNIFWDQTNVDGVNSPDKLLYLVSKGAVAMGSKAFYPGTWTDIGSQIKGMSNENRFIPGLAQDWSYKTTCDNDLTLHEYKVKLTWDAFVNPAGCDEENTGILVFKCA
jgi:hypothetical protein